MKNSTALPDSFSGEEGAATAEYAIATMVAVHGCTCIPTFSGCGAPDVTAMK